MSNNMILPERFVCHDLPRRTQSMHLDGLPNALRSEFRSVKLMWLLMFTTSVSVCLFFIVNSTLRFLRFQVITSYRLQSEYRTTFPMVTVCNLNPLNSEYYLQLYKEANVANLTILSYLRDYEILVSLENYSKRTTGRFLSAEQKRRLSDMDGLVISCTFQNKPCNSSQLQYVLSPKYLVSCLRFNSGFDAYNQPVELHTATADGASNELNMELYVGMPDAIRTTSPLRGANILIQNQSESNVKLTPVPTVVTPGFATNINVVRTVYHQFNEWPFAYSECTVDEQNRLLAPLEDRSLFDRVVALNFTYKRETCLLVCYQTFLHDVCNCSDLWVEIRIDGSDYCLGDLEKSSVNFYYNVFHVGDFVDTHCMPLCPLECSLYRYDLHKSLDRYPSDSYVEHTLRTNPILRTHFANHTDFKLNLAQNVVKFTIKYDSLAYLEASESMRMSWHDLLAELGGHFHLFVGMSFLTALEILELFF